MSPLSRAVVVAVLAATGGAARAEPVTLRLASVAPDGTAWARELRAFGREVAMATHDQVLVKWYLGGIAGDELQQNERVKRDQLDGIISGGMLCQKLAPSMRAAGMVNLFRDRDEENYVMSRMQPILDGEFAKAGYVDVGNAGIGFSVIFSRTPMRSMDDLRTMKLWLWDLDEILKAQLGAMGVNYIALPVEVGARAYDERRVDGFVGLPSAALAFQWSTQARYVTNLRVGYLTACMLIARRSWDVIPHDEQQLILGAVGKLRVRIEDAAQKMDEVLIGGGLFAKQGLQVVAPPPALQTEFAEAARRTQKAAEALMPPGMAERVAGWLAEYRSRRGGSH